MNTGVPLEAIEEVAAAAAKQVAPCDEHVAAVTDTHVVPTYDDHVVPTYDDHVVPAHGAGAAAMARARLLGMNRASRAEGSTRRPAARGGANPRAATLGIGASATHRAATLGIGSALASRASALGLSAPTLAASHGDAPTATTNRAARLGLARVPVDAAVTPTTADPTGKTERSA